MGYKSLIDYSDITPFAKCPSCSRMIELSSFTDVILEDSKTCPFCNTVIEKKEIISSCEKYLKKTNGIKSAEKILGNYTSIPIVITLIMIEFGLTYLFDWRKYNVLFFLTVLFSTINMLGGFLNTKNWLAQFSKFLDADEEFLSAKEKIRRAQLIWVWLNIFNVVWWFIYIRFF